jgi:hypothetical protein
MLFAALIIGRICGSIAESKGKDKRRWFWIGFSTSLVLIMGLHQMHELKKLKALKSSQTDKKSGI